MSSVPGVLAGLTAVGKAALPSSQVINGGWASQTITRERLLLVGDEEILINRQFDSLSDVTMSEEYDVPLTAAADLSGADPLIADAAAFADYETFVQAVLDHPSGHTLGLEASGVISVLPTGEQRFQRLSDENGRHAVVRFVVHVYAQVA